MRLLLASVEHSKPNLVIFVRDFVIAGMDTIGNLREVLDTRKEHREEQGCHQHGTTVSITSVEEFVKEIAPLRLQFVIKRYECF